MIERPSNRQKQILQQLARLSVIWAVVAIVTAVALIWFVKNTLSRQGAQEELIVAQNKIRQTLDINYYDWNTATLAIYAPQLASAIQNTWSKAGQVWPNLGSDWAKTPVVLMSVDTTTAFLFHADGQMQELPDLVVENDLTSLPAGWHVLTDLPEFPDQTILLRVLDSDYFSNLRHQNLEWSSAPLPGVLFAQVTAQVFEVAQANQPIIAQDEPEASASTVVDFDLYRLRFEILAALQAALVESDQARRDNYLDRATYFYDLSRAQDVSSSAVLETLDKNAGTTAYFSWLMRLRASYDFYQLDSSFDDFVSKVARTDLTLEKAGLDFTPTHQANWLGALSGLLLDRLGTANWKQRVIVDGTSPLQILLGGRLITQDYSPNARVEEIFNGEITINQEIINEGINDEN